MAVSLNWLYLWTSIVVIFISLHHVKGQCTAFPTTQFTQSVECSDGLNDTSVCTYICLDGSTLTSTCNGTLWTVNHVSCSACADGVWGVNCQEDCTCISGSSCNNVNGACTACGIIECDKRNLQVSLNRQGTYNIAHTDVLEIICNVNLPNNEVSVWWNAPNYSSDPVVPENGIFTLSKTDLQPEKDSGVYGCYAEARNAGIVVVGSSTASVTVDVQVLATIVEIPDSQEIEISSSPVFTCSGHGKPLPEVSWQTINGGPISESDTEIIEDGYFMNSTLTFNSVDRNDNGIYQCVVNNGYDDVSENFTLTVLEVPDQVTIITFIATNAEIIELKWEVTYDGNSDIIQCGVEYMEFNDQQQPVTDWMTYITVTEIRIQCMIQIENLAAYTYYKARISCTNSQGSSVPTETVIVRTKESSSNPPRNVTLVANTESDITVTWLVPVKLNGELDYYIVYYSIISGSNTMNKQIPDKPRISSFHNTSDSALTIEWNPPINPRGVTKRYELYLFLNSGGSAVKSHTEHPKQSDQTSTYTYLFTNLLAYTEYIVRIKVCNGRRCSLAEEKSAKTSEGIHALIPYEGFDGHVGMEDSKGSWLVYDNTCYEYQELQTYSNCYEIIVIRIPISKETGSLLFDTSVSPDSIYGSTELNKYEDVNGIPGQAYVAVRMTRNSFQEEVLIGDGKLTECTQNSNLTVKRDIAQYSYEREVYNGELEPETWYTVFVRAYVDIPSVDGQVFFTSSPFMEPIQTGDDGENLEVNIND
uniref:Uncharacterized protein LOC100370277 n=1 Tax=Saccoglossus kowalevskii TaxID=10224 RepID=A0ABM0GX42_SACKO|nr:PREDICTED: uncharacterized protein LOC100370277 [Saccoglossus kowalevskii]